MERYNNDFLVFASEADIAKWMLEKNMEFMFTDIRDERSRPLRLQNFIMKANLPIQEKIINACVSALKCWDPEKHSPETLENLAYFSALTRNYNTVPELIRLIDENKVPEDKDDNEVRTKSIVIAVIAGFAEREEAKSALKRWYEDENMGWIYTALLFNGVIKAYPENAEAFFPKALKIFDEHSDYFVLGYVASALVENLGSDKSKKILSKFNCESARLLEKGIEEDKEISRLVEQKDLKEPWWF